MNIEELLSKRIYMPDIENVVSRAGESEENIFRLWHLVRSDDRMASVNALRAMTHLPETNDEYLASLRNGMIDMLLVDSCKWISPNFISLQKVLSDSNIVPYPSCQAKSMPVGLYQFITVR